MVWLVFSGAVIGFVHSLSPAHWIPVTVVARKQGWTPIQSVVGALVVALGHVSLSVGIGLFVVGLGAGWIQSHEEALERYWGIALVILGLAYALYAFRKHGRCTGHTHHGPTYEPGQKPYAFLFMTGFSPCLAALPIFTAAMVYGYSAVVLTLGAFSVGVAFALTGAVWLVAHGFRKLDHPFLEHYADVLAGVGVAAAGGALILMSILHH